MATLDQLKIHIEKAKTEFSETAKKAENPRNDPLARQKLKKVKILPDGNTEFTRSMGMLIQKNHVGFGLRSWRYCAIINDGIIEKWWQEPGINNMGIDNDPYEETTPENCIKYLKELAFKHSLKSA